MFHYLTLYTICVRSLMTLKADRSITECRKKNLMYFTLAPHLALAVGSQPHITLWNQLVSDAH